MKKFLLMFIGIFILLGVALVIYKYNDKKYIIKYSDASGIMFEQEVKNGNTITKPQDPIKEGYEFLYWGINAKEFDFNTKVKENLELEAVWKKQDVYSISMEKITEEESKLKIYKNGVDVSESIEGIYNGDQENVGTIDKKDSSIIIREGDLDKIGQIKEAGKIIKLEPKSKDLDNCPSDMICIDPKEKWYGKELAE